MKTILALLLLIVSNNTFGQQLYDSSLIKHNTEGFYCLTSENHDKLILFLHGGVNNPYFKKPLLQIELNYLIENNFEFITQGAQNGFDFIIPIANDSLNWLIKPTESFEKLKEFIYSTNKKYKEIYIAGFSDGGTGAFKIFYTNQVFFDGLVVFNGYPQHQNFYKTIDYTKVTNKKIVFFGTLNDKIIPYEFLLTEYCSQKISNANTYFYLANGNHGFMNYKNSELNELFGILTSSINNTMKDPIQGYMRNDVLIKLYPYRKKILRKYNYGKKIYDENKKQLKKYKATLNNG